MFSSSFCEGDVLSLFSDELDHSSFHSSGLSFQLSKFLPFRRPGVCQRFPGLRNTTVRFWHSGWLAGTEDHCIFPISGTILSKPYCLVQTKDSVSSRINKSLPLALVLRANKFHSAPTLLFSVQKFFRSSGVLVISSVIVQYRFL